MKSWMSSEAWDPVSGSLYSNGKFLNYMGRAINQGHSMPVTVSPTTGPARYESRYGFSSIGTEMAQSVVRPRRH
jgi:hypothetical protein